MRFGVTTGELTTSASALRADADGVAASGEPLSVAAESAGEWACGRAQRAAQAFFDTLARAAQDAAVGLRDLGERAAVGADEYQGVEGRLFPER